MLEQTPIQSECIKKKRGRKKKVDETLVQNIQVSLEEIIPPTEHVLKKRGRKPKGGKLTLKTNDINTHPTSIANIILHLKCSLNDLANHNLKINKLVSNPHEYNPVIPPDILTYNEEDMPGFGIYEQSGINDSNEIKNIIETNVDNKYMNNYAYISNKSNSMLCVSCNHKLNTNTVENITLSNTTPNDNQNQPHTDNTSENENENDYNIKDINAKLKKLKINLYKNTIQDKKSACFWCTYDYDNSPCYIPKYELDNKIYGYGSFCRPECAVAYLMKENIDDSAKFERYHLLNQLYTKVYDYKKNIKPAANPYYLLDKYYGNLTIQEYRKLLKTEHMLLVIDKPMTRILPELHEDNEDIMTNIYGNNINSKSNSIVNNTGVYKVKRQTDKNNGPSKSSIIKDTFGIM